MTDKRHYQLENLELDLSQRFRFNMTNLQREDLNDEDDVAWYAERAVKIAKILTKVRTRIVPLTVQIE